MVVAVPVIVRVRLVGGADDHDAPVRADHVDRRGVQLAQHLGAQHLVGGADAEPPAGQVEHPVDVLEDRVHVVGDEQHPEAALAAVPVDQVADDALRAQVERAERLVAEQQAGVAGERLPDAQPLLLAAGEAGRPARARSARRRPRRAGRRCARRRAAVGQRDPPAVTVDAERDQVAAAEGDPVIRRASAAGCSRCAGRRGGPARRGASHSPALSGCCPSTAFSRLVLPEPFAPSTAMNSPGATSRSRPRPQRAAAQGEGGVAEGEDGRSRHRRARASISVAGCPFCQLDVVHARRAGSRSRATAGTRLSVATSRTASVCGPPVCAL